MVDRSNPGQNHAEASPFLENALLFTIVAHAMAMVSMALFLLPGIPGGGTESVGMRAAYVAMHPWLWRLGWLPWQLTALSDLLLALALLCTRWVPKLPAVIAVVATVAAIVPDQMGQFLWTWVGPGLAGHDGYGEFETRIFHLISGWGTIGYIVGALGWTWCFAAAGAWSKRLTWLSIATWPIFAVSTAMLMLAHSSLAMKVVSVGNAVAFVLLMIWLIDVTEIVLRRSRPVASHGRYAPWRHPSHGPLARLCDLVANSRFARAVGELFFPLAMDSDITDIVYANYLVEADRLDAFVVEPLKLQRLGPTGGYALFTFLTFRHGHFGPRCFGPLRRLWPSPIQSNWRIHVYDPVTGKRGIQFLTIAINWTPYALVARLLAENVPMHVSADAYLSRSADGVVSLQIDSGDGTAPDVAATFTPSTEPELTGAWAECFGHWREMLGYCVPQDRAMSVQPERNRVVRQEITLDIPLESCRPMSGSVKSNAASAIAGDATPICFLIDKLAFRLLGEEYDEHSTKNVAAEVEAEQGTVIE